MLSAYSRCVKMNVLPPVLLKSRDFREKVTAAQWQLRSHHPWFCPALPFLLSWVWGLGFGGHKKANITHHHIRTLMHGFYQQVFACPELTHLRRHGRV